MNKLNRDARNYKFTCLVRQNREKRVLILDVYLLCDGQQDSALTRYNIIANSIVIANFVEIKSPEK